MKFFDLHVDTIWKLYKQTLDTGEHQSLLSNQLKVDQNKLIEGDYFAVCFAMFIDAYKGNSNAVCKKMIDLYKQELAKCDMLSPVNKFSDFEANSKNGKISSVLTIEEGEVLEGNIDNLQEFYDLGVKMICLTHNMNNCIGFNNYGRYIDGRPDWVTPNPKGLTEFGIQVVEKMNELGMVIDLSHISDGGFYQAIEISSKPVMCSHSNARALCGSLRNLTDDMLKKLADNGGLTGINIANSFLGGENTIELMVKQITYVKNLIGIDHIGIGTDFDGLNHEVEFANCSQMPKLLIALEKAGFTEQEIEKITYKNALRVFKANIK